MLLEIPIQNKSKHAFTLIELLTVIAIIGLLLTLLLPAVTAARSTARRLSCQNNMRQTGLAIHSFIESKGIFPPAKCTYTYTKNGATIQTVGHGLIPFLLPFLEQTDAFSQYHFGKNWQNAANQKAREIRIRSLICPESESVRFCRYGTGNTASQQRIVEYHCTDYTSCDSINTRTLLREQGIDRRDWRNILAPAVLGTRTYPVVRNDDPSDYDVLSVLNVRPIIPSAVTDGLSQSMMLFECVGRPYKYDFGRVRGNPDNTPKEPILGARWADDESQIGIHTIYNGTQMFNGSNHQEIFSLHPGGCNFLFGDGAIRFLIDSMSPDAFVSSFTAYADDAATIP